jgi:putative ABC transport system substrate-binding protein
MRRREFVAGLGAAVWPVAARAQQPARMRRIGVLGLADENDPPVKTFVSAFTHALADLGWADGRNVQTFGGPAATPIGCKRSRKSWSACNPTSSWQAGPR